MSPKLGNATETALNGVNGMSEDVTAALEQHRNKQKGDRKKNHRF